MATTYKDLVITPFRGDANNVPTIRFSSGDATSNSDMNVRFYATSNGALSFEGGGGVNERKKSHGTPAAG